MPSDDGGLAAIRAIVCAKVPAKKIVFDPNHPHWGSALVTHWNASRLKRAGGTFSIPHSATTLVYRSATRGFEDAFIPPN